MPRQTMTWLARLTLTCAVSSAIGACATVPAPSPGTCAGWSPIGPTQSDTAAISDTLARQILAHDKHGQQACGWAP